MACFDSLETEQQPMDPYIFIYTVRLSNFTLRSVLYLENNNNKTTDAYVSQLRKGWKLENVVALNVKVVEKRPRKRVLCCPCSRETAHVRVIHPAAPIRPSGAEEEDRALRCSPAPCLPAALSLARLFHCSRPLASSSLLLFFFFPSYLWKRHFKSLPVWISLSFLCVSPCQ